MKHLNARAIQIGLLVLAVVALLGWLRKPAAEPETGFTVTSARPTYAPPPVPEAAPVEDREYVPEDFAVPRRSVRSVRVTKPAPVTKQRMARNGEPLGVVQTEAGRHQLPGPVVIDQPREERRAEPAEEDRVQNDRDEIHNQRRDDERSSPVVTASRRSGKKSALIIGGAAAAGAAIGGAAGGGKGAAIGAITGGLGGFVYDRMTREGDDSSVAQRDSSTQARNYSTPNFMGR